MCAVVCGGSGSMRLWTWGPAALVGRQVRVFWPEDIAWYLGRVASFDVEGSTHRVRVPPSLRPPPAEVFHPPVEGLSECPALCISLTI